MFITLSCSLLLPVFLYQSRSSLWYLGKEMDPQGGHMWLFRPPMASGDTRGIFWNFPPPLGGPPTHFWLLRVAGPYGDPKMVKNVKNDHFWPKNRLKSGYFGGIWPPYHPWGCISTIWGHMHPFIGILTYFCLKKGYFWWKSSFFIKNSHFWGKNRSKCL